jgi:hypothetical protein
VWSVWSERVQVYLGTGMVLVQRPGVAELRLSPPATLPLSDVLALVDEACQRERAKPWRLQVSLSAALCPPVVFTVPEGVKQWRETQAIAQATAAAQLGLSPGTGLDPACSLDTQHTGLAAALMPGTHQQILAWADRHKGRLASLQPLWATATRARACHTAAVQQLTVLEPDALTALYLPGGQAAPQAITWLGNHSTEDADALVRSWMQAQGLDGPHMGKTVRVRFAALAVPARQQWANGPAGWPTHWEAVAP